MKAILELPIYQLDTVDKTTITVLRNRCVLTVQDFLLTALGEFDWIIGIDEKEFPMIIKELD